MKTLAMLRSSMQQGRRDLLTVALSLVFAPLFVLLYAALYSEGVTYQVAVINADRPVTTSATPPLDAGSALVAALSRTASDQPDSVPVRLAVRTVADRQAGVELLRRRDVSLLVEFPADLSRRVARGQDAAITLEGNPTDQKYLIAAIAVTQTAETYVATVTGRSSPLTISERPLTGTDALSDFDLSVGGLMVFSVIMLVFLASMSVARDVESGVMRRLRLTGMRATDYLTGTSGMLLLVALTGVLLTFATALACGFHSNGPLWAAILITMVTALSVIGVGLMVGGLCRNVGQAFVFANFPLGLMMFLSGAVFPVPAPTVVTLGGNEVGPFDLIPATAAVNALNKIMVLGQGLTQVTFELTELVVLSLLYFALGAVVLHRRHLRISSR
jgi:ABC-2 type transport system permease protein